MPVFPRFRLSDAEKDALLAPRSTWRNGYRDRSLDTRFGTLNLKILKLRTGAYFPGFLECNCFCGCRP